MYTISIIHRLTDYQVSTQSDWPHRGRLKQDYMGSRIFGLVNYHLLAWSTDRLWSKRAIASHRIDKRNRGLVNVDTTPRQPRFQGPLSSSLEDLGNEVVHHLRHQCGIQFGVQSQAFRVGADGEWSQSLFTLANCRAVGSKCAKVLARSRSVRMQHVQTERFFQTLVSLQHITTKGGGGTFSLILTHIRSHLFNLYDNIFQVGRVLGYKQSVLFIKPRNRRLQFSFLWDWNSTEQLKSASFPLFV